MPYDLFHSRLVSFNQRFPGEIPTWYQGKLDSGEIVAVSEGSTMKADAMTKALDELDSLRDKTAPGHGMAWLVDGKNG